MPVIFESMSLIYEQIIITRRLVKIQFCKRDTSQFKRHSSHLGNIPVKVSNLQIHRGTKPH